ncbi:MAG: MBL fold metallo-hydrolase, partial [Planktomarina sp.]
MEVIADQTTLFDDGVEILPGIMAVASPGHTPGHMSFQIQNKALVIGDAIGNAHIAFGHPDWRSGSDQDADLAVKSRQMLLDRAVADQLQLVGFHLPGGGMGRAERDGSAYKFIGGAS